MSTHSQFGYFGGVNPFKWNNVASNSTPTNEFIDPQSADFDFSGLGNNSIASPESVPGFNSGGGFGETPLSDSFSLGFNKGTLQLGTAAIGAWNGWQANKAAKAGNEIARQELAQNAKSFDINAGLQLATMQAEEGRRNAYAGGFLDDSQRSDRFKDYDLQKLSVS
jgi:hypothetical protein